MGFSLFDVYKKKIYEVLDSIVVQNNYKYLVLDDYTSRLVGNVVENIELLKRNISAVEIIEEKRQPKGSFEAVYILTARPHILECLISDYARATPRYAAAHVFFVPIIDVADRSKLLSSPAGKFIRTCLPLLLDYFPKESNVFTFNESNALPIFYNTECLNIVSKTVRKTAKKLVSVCASLGEYPIVRFYSPREPTHDAYTLPYLLANEFQKELDEYARANRNFPSVESNRPQSVFIIADRTLDLKEPFLHEFSYEAMAHDLLYIEDGNKYTYDIVVDNDRREKVTGVLSESDPIWVKLRHKYIADAMEGVREKIVKFTEENSTLINMQNASASQLKDVMLTIKVFSKEKDQLSLHSNMTETISELFSRTRLSDIANIEQCLATGLNDEGKHPRTVLEELVPLLDDPQVSSRDKVRLVALYLMFRDGIIEADFKKLCYHAKLSSADIQSLRNLDLLGFQIIKKSLHERRKPKKAPRPDYDDTKEFTEISRYAPSVRRILDDIVQNSLDSQDFPLMKDQHDDVSVISETLTPAPTGTSSTSRRNKATWHDRSAGIQTPAQRIFIFIAGGVTYGECRAAYDISHTYNKEVIIGSEEILTPQMWLQNLFKIRAPRKSLNLIEDQPEVKAPAHLFEPDVVTTASSIKTAASSGASKIGKPAASSGHAVPSSAPNKLSRNPEHSHHKPSGNPPGHFNVEKKKSSKLGKLFR
ncbi:Sec1-like protein [Dipodascopsis uninucleata]